MAIVSQNVQVSSEVLALGSLVSGIVGDIKGGKGAAQVVQDALPQLIQVLGGLSQLSADVAVPSVLDNSLALVLVQLKGVLLPSVV